MDNKKFFDQVLKNQFDIEAICHIILEFSNKGRIEREELKSKILNKAYDYYLNYATIEEQEEYDKVLGSVLLEKLENYRYDLNSFKKYVQEHLVTKSILEEQYDNVAEEDGLLRFIQDNVRYYYDNLDPEEKKKYGGIPNFLGIISTVGNGKRIERNLVDEIQRKISESKTVVKIEDQDENRKQIFDIIVGNEFDSAKITKVLNDRRLSYSFSRSLEIANSYYFLHASASEKEKYRLAVASRERSKKQNEVLARDVYEFMKETKSVKKTSARFGLSSSKTLELYYQYRFKIVSRKLSSLSDMSDMQRYELSKYLFYVCLNHQMDITVFLSKEKWLRFLDVRDGSMIYAESLFQKLLNEYLEKEEDAYGITASEKRALEKLEKSTWRLQDMKVKKEESLKRQRERMIQEYQEKFQNLKEFDRARKHVFDYVSGRSSDCLLKDMEYFLKHSSSEIEKNIVKRFAIANRESVPDNLYKVIFPRHILYNVKLFPGLNQILYLSSNLQIEALRNLEISDFDKLFSDKLHLNANGNELDLQKFQKNLQIVLEERAS